MGEQIVNSDVPLRGTVWHSVQKPQHFRHRFGASKGMYTWKYTLSDILTGTVHDLFSHCGTQPGNQWLPQQFTICSPVAERINRNDLAVRFTSRFVALDDSLRSQPFVTRTDSSRFVLLLRLRSENRLSNRLLTEVDDSTLGCSDPLRNQIVHGLFSSSTTSGCSSGISQSKELRP